MDLNAGVCEKNKIKNRFKLFFLITNLISSSNQEKKITVVCLLHYYSLKAGAMIYSVRS